MGHSRKAANGKVAQLTDQSLVQTGCDGVRMVTHTRSMYLLALS